MGRATCSVCHEAMESRSLTTCPGCYAFVCESCAQQSNGYCQNCDEQE